MQPDADGICTHGKDDCDLAGSQRLPGPETKQLPIIFRKAVQGRMEFGVSYWLSVGGLHEWWVQPGDADNEILLPASRPQGVVQAEPGDSKAPGERVLRRNIVEPSPHHEQCVCDDLVGQIVINAPHDVSAQRFGHRPDQRLEPLLI